MSVMRVRRVDAQARRLTAVSIPRDVFGMKRPRWILDPPKEIQDHFWAVCGDSIPNDAEVFVAEGMYSAEQLRDAHERPIPGLESARGEVALFFIDLTPEANWGHPCEYVLIHTDGSILRAKHIWRPAHIPLTQIERPPSR